MATATKAKVTKVPTKPTAAKATAKPTAKAAPATATTPSTAGKSRPAVGDPTPAASRLLSSETAANITGGFKLVSDPTRLQVLALLSAGELCVGDLCAALKASQPAVNHHLSLLRHARLIEPRRQEKNNFYSLTASGRLLWDAAMRYGEAIAL